MGGTTSKGDLALTCQKYVSDLELRTDHMHRCIMAQHDFLADFIKKSSANTADQTHHKGVGAGTSVDDTSHGAYGTGSPPSYSIEPTNYVEEQSMETASKDLMAFIQNSSFQCAEDLRAEVERFKSFFATNFYDYIPYYKRKQPEERRPPIKYQVKHVQELGYLKTGINAGSQTDEIRGKQESNVKLSDQINVLHAKNESLEESLRRAEDSLRKTENSLRIAVDSLRKTEENLKLAEDTLRRKNDDIKDKNNDIKRLRKDLADAKASHQPYTKPWFSSAPPPRRKASALLFCQRQSDLLNSVCGEITKMLSDKFAMQNTDLMMGRCDGANGVQENTPVIVLCINASRLGTDVTNAIAGLRLTPFVAVVILHHKDRHALPNQTSDRVLTAPEYKSLGGIFDMAFLSGKGIYPCDMNTTAVTNLVSFIDKFNTG